VELIDWKLPYCTRPDASHQGYFVRDWRDAERMAALWIRRFGYTDARLTSPGNDDGIDVQATGAVAQVKWWEWSNAGIEDAQRIVGAAKPGQNPLFFSRKGYTSAALRWADDPDARLALFLLHIDGHITAINRHAMEVLYRAPRRTPPYMIEPLPTRTRLEYGILSLLGTAAAVPVILTLPMSDWSVNPGARVLVLLTALFCGIGHAINASTFLGSTMKRLIRSVRRCRWPGMRAILTDVPPSRPDRTMPWEEFEGLAPRSSLLWGILLEHLICRLRKVARQAKGWWIRGRSASSPKS
jgi:hypothetical protein